MGSKAKPRPVGDSEGQAHVVPVGSFVDPHLPEADGASVNFGHDGFWPTDDHPLEHNPAYGMLVGGLGDPVEAHEAESESESESSDEDSRSSWLKADWEELAAQYDLEVPSGATKLDIVELVEAHEAELAKGVE